MADLIQKGRDIAVRCYAHEPDKIVIPHRLSDFEWIQRNNGRIALALEGYLGILDCHYGPHKWVTSFGRLDWRVPQLFLFKPIPDALKVFFLMEERMVQQSSCSSHHSNHNSQMHIYENILGLVGGPHSLKNYLLLSWRSQNSLNP